MSSERRIKLDCGAYKPGLGTLLVAAILLAVMLVTVPRMAWATGSASSKGTLTIEATGQNSGVTYRAYQLFDATVNTGANGESTASNIAWASDEARSAVESAIKAGDPTYAGTTAQDAADWLSSAGEDKVQEVATQVAEALEGSVASDGMDVVTLKANSSEGGSGASATVSTGYWLIVSDDSQLGDGQSGTAPMLVLVGASGVSVTPKGGTPTVEKHVLEDSTNTWQKAADATVGDELYWRLEATVPQGLGAYASYSVTFEDTLAKGLDAPDPATVRVQFHCGLDGDWSSDEDWIDLSGCSIVSEGTSLTVATPDLVAAVRQAGASFSDGVQVRVVYSAPLNAQANHGSAKGNPNKVRLDYPASPVSSQRGKTPWAIATAYTWDVVFQKQSSADNSALPGAVLSVVDDRGRHLTGEGLWVMGDATVTTNSDGQVVVRGVDSGVLSVSETQAPDGYVAFEGSRDLTMSTSISEQQSAADKVTMKVSAQSPLEALAAEPESGQVTVAVLNSPSPGSEMPGSTNELLRNTGDPTTYGVMALVVGAGIAAIVVSRKLRRGGGQ